MGIQQPYFVTKYRLEPSNKEARSGLTRQWQQGNKGKPKTETRNNVKKQ